MRTLFRSGWAIATWRRQRYADYAPNEREVEMVDRAFGDPGA
jgi:transposase